jgi:hypothetical protein
MAIGQHTAQGEMSLAASASLWHENDRQQIVTALFSCFSSIRADTTNRHLWLYTMLRYA